MVDFIGLLKKEVLPAEGCTEPIAVAYAVAIAAEHLGGAVSCIDLRRSANIIKNALGVGIPGTGMVGIDIAAALGAVVKHSRRSSKCFPALRQASLMPRGALVDAGVIHIEQKATPEVLYIEAIVSDGTDTARVIICRDHTNVVRIERNREVLVDRKISVGEGEGDEGTGLTLENIFEFATTVPFEEIAFILDCVPMNTRVSEEGLKGGYGLEVGRRVGAGSSCRGALLNNATLRIMSATAAASDARMGGCPLSIMTCAGSGNQGIACSMPVIELGRLLGASDEEIARAIVISDLHGYPHQRVHGSPVAAVRRGHRGRYRRVLRHDLSAGWRPAADQVRGQ